MVILWKIIMTVLKLFLIMLYFLLSLVGRSIGKTYFFKRQCIKDFLKKKKQFIYVRRYKEELQKTINSFFDDVRKEFPDNKFAIRGNKFYIDGEVARLLLCTFYSKHLEIYVFSRCFYYSFWWVHYRKRCVSLFTTGS